MHPIPLALETPMKIASMLAVAAVVVPLATASATRGGRTPGDYANPRTSVLPRALTLALRTARIPSFARQTKLACSVCHYQFPELTPFGRLFKLNGYTLTGLTPITSTQDSTKAATLELAPIPP